MRKPGGEFGSIGIDTTSHGKETVRSLADVTAYKLGWQPSTLRLASKSTMEVQVHTAENGRRTFCLVGEPLMGRRLLEVLTGATKKPDRELPWDAVLDTYGDLDLFRMAERDPAAYKRVLEMHTGNKEIGTAMETFGKDHVTQWRKAFEVNGRLLMREPVLEIASQIDVVNLSVLPRKVLDETMTDQALDPKDFIGNSLRSLYVFNQFFDTRNDLPIFLRRITGESHENWGNRFDKMSESWRRGVLEKYVEWLRDNPEHATRAVVHFMTEHKGKVLLDVGDGSGTVYRPWNMEGERGSVTLGEGEIIVEDKDTRVELDLEKTTDPERPFVTGARKVISAPSKLQHALYPVIAWTEADATEGRVFKTIDEIKALFGNTLVAPTEQLDPWVGMAFAAGYSPAVLRETPESMRLVKGGRLREVGPAQVHLHDNLPSTQAALLEEKDGPLGKLEKRATACGL